MSETLYFVILGAVALTGFLARRWLLVALVLCVWVLGLTIAACVGAFHHTAEDSSGLLFFFAAWATMLWVLAFTLGTATGSTIHALSRRLRR